ncbi:MAG: aminomethyl-transferring glycine dehydrogenase subunit GcvPA [Candidatus Caldarchaeum sp.]|nr:aminomethyl-transferring glycine dehydrogenase subunit GcvPA [Candidatus Caldarchaeum sp.]
MSDSFVPYFGHHTKKDLEEMLSVIGVKDIFELYSDVPSKYILEKAPAIDGPRSEQEVFEMLRKILGKNAKNLKLFIGGGVWPHYIPASVKEIASRSEFLTSYTPYQPEVSQGILTAMFEFQSLVADLYAVDVVNSSMYDWATAVGEAFRMAIRYNGRRKIVVAGHVGPDRLKVAQTYVKPLETNIEKIPFLHDGTIDEEALKQTVDKETAAVYVENPCYLGALVSNVDAVGEIAHERGALFIVGAEPTSLGLFAPPGEYGADIVVGEGQPLGLPMSFGGPLLGILGCSSDRRLIHVMPGRIVGMTETVTDRRRAFTMVLRAREQDIKREKATSNICTNQAFCAVIAAAYLSLLGKHGLRQLAEHIFNKTAYFAQTLAKTGKVVSPILDAPHYMEFAYRIKDQPSSKILQKLLEKGIVGGLPVGRDFPSLGDAVLTCVTEVHSVEDIDFYVETVEEVV